MKQSFSVTSVCVFALAVALAHPAAAQTATTDGTQASSDQSSADTVADIVVFAQKRTEKLQNVPISATAVSGDDLRKAGVDRSDQIAALAPNVTFAAGNFDAAPKIYIRGVGSNEFTQNANGGVGVYVDEVYKGLTTGQTFSLFDLGRVEVLRGPQSTLYGKNTSGGVINFFSERPTNEFGAGVNALYGSYNRFETDGYVNIPLSKTIAARISFANKDRDGLFLNEFTGEREGRVNNFAVRGQLSFRPSNDFEALLKVEKGSSNTDFKNGRHIGLYDPAAVGNPAALRLIIDPANGQFLPGYDLFRAGVDFLGYRGPSQSLRGSSDYQQSERIDFVNSSLRLEWDLGSASLVSITGYEDVNRAAKQDADYSPNHIFHNDWISDSNLFSQELRLTGDAGPIKYIVGAFYYQDQHNVNLPLDFFGCFTDPNPARRCTSIIPGLVLPRTLIDFKYTQKSENLAGFGQLTYGLSDRLSVTAGLRYTWESRTIDAISRSSQPCVVPGFVFTPANPNPPAGTPACALGGTYAPFSGNKSWDDVLGKVGIDFKASDNLFLYASFNQGFKAGNWNGGAYDQLAAIQNPVNPEKTDTYEIGLKSDLFDRKLRVNLSAFYTNVKDLQVFIFQNASTVLQNAAKARIYGVEAEIVAVPTSGLRLSLSGGYLNGQYKDFVASVADPANPFGSRVTRDLSGNTIVQSPKFSLSGAVQYTTKVNSDWDVEFGVDANYRSRVFFTVFNDYLNQGGYALVNGRVRLGKINDSLSITAAVTNIFDKRYFNDAAQIGLPFGVDEVFEAYNPRTFQISVSTKF